jgi:hypothetical protein
MVDRRAVRRVFLAVIIVVSRDTVASFVLDERILHAERSAAGAPAELWGLLTIDAKITSINSI